MTDAKPRAVVWMCLDTDDGYGEWSQHASDRKEFQHCYINADQLLEWLRSGPLGKYGAQWIEKYLKELGNVS